VRVAPFEGGFADIEDEVEGRGEGAPLLGGPRGFPSRLLRRRGSFCLYVYVCGKGF